jgi:hypothetical protein
VGEHFIPNPDNLPIVNHKDSDRSNFKVFNLEWVSNSGNQLHRWETEKAGLKKKKYIREYSMKDTNMSNLQDVEANLDGLPGLAKGAALINKAKIEQIKKAQRLKSKGLTRAEKAFLVRDESYKAAGMGKARRAINHLLPFNSVVF